MPPSVLSRGIGWQGVGILFSGIFGTGNGCSVSVENAGLLGLTRVGKFGAVFASTYCSSIVLFVLRVRGVKFILGFSIFMGLSIPQYFNEYTALKGYGPVHTKSRWWNDMVNVPFSSEAFVGGLLAMLLDVTLTAKDTATRTEECIGGISFKTDTRSQEFYSLPFNLNNFFPSV